MARLGCKCGHTMGSSECPSPYSFYVYYGNEVMDAIKENKELRLIDFIMNWDELNSCRKEYMIRKEAVDYWHCPECNRVYECQARGEGHWLRAYRREDNIEKSFDKRELIRLYVFSEVNSDNVLEENPDILLSEYISGLNQDFYVTKDETYVYAFNHYSEEVLFAYVLEETLPSVLPDGFAYEEYIKEQQI